jgi:hypothetical protein
MLASKEELEKLLADAPDTSGEISVFDLNKICDDFGDDVAPVVANAATISRGITVESYLDKLEAMFSKRIA